MSRSWDPRKRGSELSILDPDSPIPARAVLTELARGFLLTHDSDPDRASRFAVTFLRERAGRAVPERIIPIRQIATLRRGIAPAVGSVRPPRDVRRSRHLKG
jgi:hypothetical protein